MFKSAESLERLLIHCCRRHLIDDFSVDGDRVTLTVGSAVHTLTRKHATEYVAWLLEQEDTPDPDIPHEVPPPPDAGASATAPPPDDG